MIYEIDKNEWKDPELSHEIPRWNHSAIMAPSIPSWKYFIFGGSTGSFEEGGNRTTSKFTNDVFYLDVDSFEWRQVSLEPEEESKKVTVPKPRENASIFYDTNESRVLIFGGWANNWMDDMWSLNVSTITGPPYAIFSIKPKLGPLTGKTKVQIFGEGFKQSQNISIKFQASGKAQQEVQGVFINEQELACDTPSFEQFGPKKVTVTVSINKADYTITSTEYAYFLNTKAEKTIAYGPGLLSGEFKNAVGEETVFIIQARDGENKNRTSGNDSFIVEIIRPDKIKKAEEPVEEGKEGAGE